MYRALCLVTKDLLTQKRVEFKNKVRSEGKKRIYYMSMEFLMGRALGNNLINLGAYTEVKEALEEIGLNLSVVEDQ